MYLFQHLFCLNTISECVKAFCNCSITFKLRAKHEPGLTHVVSHVSQRYDLNIDHNIIMAITKQHFH